MLFNANTPPSISKALYSVYSVLPGERVPGTGDDKGFKIKGLKPATGFLIAENILITARHACEQSPFAFARAVNERTEFIAKYQCKRISDYLPGEALMTINDCSDDTGQGLKSHRIEWDVGAYQLSAETQLEFLRKHSAAPGASQEVALIGISFKRPNGYRVEYEIGAINKVLRSTGPADFLLVDSPSEEGWSGGPLLDLASGNAIGVISGSYYFPPHNYTTAWTLP